MALDFSKLNTTLQGLSDKQPAVADSIMDSLGYSNSPMDTAISSTALAPEKKFELNPRDTKISTPAADRFQQESRTNADILKQQSKDLTQQTQTNAAALSKDTAQTFDDYLNTVLTAPTFSAIQQAQYKEAGVDKKQLRVDQLSTQMLAEQDALRTSIEKIQKEGGGLKSGAQAEIANLERDSIAKQADIALLQLAAQDQLDYSTRIADRATNAMFERQEKIEGARKMVYERNKELFDKTEQRAFELAQADRERQLNEEKENARLLLQTKAEALKMLNINGASEELKAAVMSETDPLGVISAAGEYGSTDMLDRQLKRAQLANANIQYAKMAKELSGGEVDGTLTPQQREKIAKMPESQKAQALMTLNTNLNRLKSLYIEYGTWNPLNREAANKISALKSQLEIDIAVAGGQGAISEQESDRYANIVGGKFFQKGTKVAASLDEAIRANNTKISNNIKYVDSAYPGAVSFEPFEAYVSETKVNDYLEKELGNSIQTDDDAIEQWLNM